MNNRTQGGVMTCTSYEKVFLDDCHCSLIVRRSWWSERKCNNETTIAPAIGQVICCLEAFTAVGIGKKGKPMCVVGCTSAH